MSDATIVDPGFERRLDFVHLVNGGLSVPAASRQIGFSPTWGYKVSRKFEEGGLEALRTKAPLPKTFPRKFREDWIVSLIQECLMCPEKGVQYISKILQERHDVSVSAGTIHSILKKHNLETRTKRLNCLFSRIREGGVQQQPRGALQGMETMSPHFKDRGYTRERLGRHIFVWSEYGRVSHSRLRLSFDIFLDSCGSVVNIVSNVDTLLANAAKTDEYWDIYEPTEPGHWLYGPTKKVLRQFYSYYDIDGETLCVVGDGICHQTLLGSMLEPSRMYVHTLPPDEYFGISFVNDFKRLFRRTFLLGDLREINHQRFGVDTAIKVHQTLKRFVEEYNQRPVAAWPNRGLSPYMFAGEKHGQSFHLPSKEEVKAKEEERIPPEGYERVKEPNRLIIRAVDK